jgi:hypothetical protein
MKRSCQRQTTSLDLARSAAIAGLARMMLVPPQADGDLPA